MSASRRELGCLAVLVDGGLVLQDGGNGLEGHSEVDILSVAYAALYSSAMVGERGDRL